MTSTAGCDCGGVPFYECSIEKTAAGFGMMIGTDCTVTAFNGEPSAGREAGVTLKSVIVRVNDVPVEDKREIVQQIKAAPSGSNVAFRLIWGNDEEGPRYTVQVTNTGAGYGMLIGPDCTVTKFNGEPSAAKAAGVLLGSIIVRVNGVVVENKQQIVQQIKAATAGTPVGFEMVPPPGAAVPAVGGRKQGT